jgi:hypothetical protein
MSGFDNDIMYAKNADFSQADNQNVQESNGLATNGQIWIGSTALNAGGTHVNVGTLSSPDGSINLGFSSPNITLQAVSNARTLVTTFNSGSGTWFINPKTVWVQVYLWGSGGGGGSGRKGTTALAGGGAGGGAGFFTFYEGMASLFSGGLAYSVGAGGSGGAAQTIDASDGSPGGAGNPSSLGSIISAGGGAGGAGINGTSAGGSSRLYSLYINSSASSGSGLQGTVTTGQTVTVNINGTVATIFMAAGGGGGGGGNTTTPRAGSTTSSVLDGLGNVLLAGAAGGISTGTINGSDAPSAYNTNGLMSAGLGGGGGGGGNSTTAGGKGGNGSIPAGGGGGGGGGITGSSNSGAGGNGGNGEIIIVEFF